MNRVRQPPDVTNSGELRLGSGAKRATSGVQPKARVERLVLHTRGLLSRFIPFHITDFEVIQFCVILYFVGGLMVRDAE